MYQKHEPIYVVCHVGSILLHDFTFHALSWSFFVYLIVCRTWTSNDISFPNRVYSCNRSEGLCLANTIASVLLLSVYNFERIPNFQEREASEKWQTWPIHKDKLCSGIVSSCTRAHIDIIITPMVRGVTGDPSGQCVWFPYQGLSPDLQVEL